MKLRVALICIVWMVSARPALASDIEGPGRFCGYAAIIDLEAGETVTTLSGGIHGGSFIWTGAFGTLEVRNIGWASRPKGSALGQLTATGQTRFRAKRRDGKYEIAIWNRQNGAAYFQTDKRFTAPQLAAINRVYLYDEWSEPEGCQLHTVGTFG